MITNDRWIKFCVKAVEACFKILFGLLQVQAMIIARTVSIPNNTAQSYIPKTRIEIFYHKVKMLGEGMVEMFVLYS